jgi:very-short-patch-repair endonuclease
MQFCTGSLEALLQTQAGVVARWQALACGLSESAISRNLRSRRWQAASPGIYATFTGLLTRPAELWAALLSASQGRFAGCREPPHGPDAVLSHETAAELHGLADQPERLIHVTIPNGRRRPRPVAGIRVHISTRLLEARHPVLSPPRTRIEETAIDLTQAARSVDDAINWLSMACGKRLTTAGRLAVIIHSRKKLRWRCELLTALGDAASGDHSLLELRYHRKVEWAHRLPRGIRQMRRELDKRVEYDDVTYPEWGVIVHLDGRTHRYAARVRDMRRDNAAFARGVAPLRYGWFDVDERPCDVAAQVALVLARNGWPDEPKRCGPGCSLTPSLHLPS